MGGHLFWNGLINCRPKPKTNAGCGSERLAQLGHELRRPEADYLRDQIYELRIG